MLSRRKGGVVILVLAIALMAGLSFALQSTQSEYEQGTFEGIDLGSNPGAQSIGADDHTFDPVGFWRLDTPLLGEAGSVSADGSWTTVSTDNYQNPIVFATSNSDNNAGSPKIAEIREVENNQFETRLCEHEDSSAVCGTQGAEDIGYTVFDEVRLDELQGVESGKVTLSGGGVGSSQTVNFDEDLSSNAVIIAEQQTRNENGESVVQSVSVGANSADLYLCDHNEDSVNACGDHGEEEVAWIAVDPGSNALGNYSQISEVGETQGISDSNWASESFTSSFSSAPAVLATIQTNNGGQQAKPSMARSVTSSGMDIRYCEHDTGDSCDGHAAEDVGWMAFGQGKIYANRAVDSSGNRNHGTTNDLASSLQFKETDYLTSSLTYSDQSQFTLTARFKAKDIQDNFQPIIGTIYGNNLAAGMVVDDSRLCYHDYNQRTFECDSEELEEGQWYTGTITFDNGQMNIYRDDTLVHSASVPNPSKIDSTIIGRVDSYSSSYPRGFEGSISEVGIYNTALNSSQVSSVHQGNEPTTGLQMYQNFQEGPSSCDLTGSSACLIDSSGNSNNATPYSFEDNNLNTGSGWSTESPGIWGRNGMEFDGSDDYISFNRPSVDLSSSSAEFSISLWLKTNSSEDQHFFTDFNENSYSFDFRVSDGYLDLRRYDGTTSTSTDDTPYQINDNKWHHIVGTRENGKLKLYVDGSLYSSIDDTTGSIGSSESLVLMQDIVDGSGGYLKGSVDNIRVVDNPLTPNQIQQLYNPTSRWSSQVLESEENTEWRHVDWTGSNPSGTTTQTRALAAEDFLEIGGFGPVQNTYLGNWYTGNTGNYDYIDFRTDFPSLLNVSMRGLDFNASQQSPEAWYSFEGMTDSVKDFSGNGVSGVLDTAERTEGYSGKGIYFTGGNRFTVSDGGQAFTNPAGTMTMEMWVHPDSLTSGSHTLVDKQNEFRLNLENNGEIWFRTYGENNQGAGNLPQGEWSHIAVEWDSGNSINTYVNGTQVDTYSITDPVAETNNPVYFGRTYDDAQYFEGKIDEVRVFRNQTGINFLTGIEDFTEPARASGKKVGPLNSNFIQLRYRPEDTQPYSVESTRIAQDSEWSSWVGNGERFDVKNSSHAIYQMNLSTSKVMNSPEIESSRMRSVIPDNDTLPGTSAGAGKFESGYENDLVVGLSINETNISTTDPVRADLVFWNTREYCSYNQGSGFCERIDSNQVNLDSARFMANNYPFSPQIDRSIYGSKTAGGSFEFQAPPSYWVEWNFQFEQDYNIEGQDKATVSNPVLDYYGLDKGQEGDSCSSSLACGDGLYCGDTTGDGSSDTCLSQDQSLQGNVCQELGAGAQERVSGEGLCEIASSGMENSNQPEGFACRTSSDCATNYCYDGNSDGQRTCQTSPASGSSGGVPSASESGDADTCYFAGKVYNPGAQESIFGVTNECVNGNWERDVKATLDYSKVGEGDTVQVDYNVYNFKQGYDYSNGFINRLNSNDIQLQEIRIGVEDQTYTKDISGTTVKGYRNQTGSISFSIPELEYTDDLTAVTYLEYTHNSNTYTIAGTPLQGGPHSEQVNSGSCRKGYQTDGQYYCVYDSQEQPYGSGEPVQTSSQAGNLCEIRASSNTERRVSTDGACKIAGVGAESNNLPNGYVCDTKEDCINDYCRDAGSGSKTCQSSPAEGTSSGVASSPQSCADDACFYGGQCYADGNTLNNAFNRGESVTCDSGKWDMGEEAMFKVSIPDQQISGTVPIDVTLHNPYEYCRWRGLACEVIDGNVMTVEDITFSVKGHDPFTVSINEQIPGEGVYNETLNVDMPAMDHTSSPQIQSVIKYSFNGTSRNSATSVIAREQAWERVSEGEACSIGHETDEGLYCEFSVEDKSNLDVNLDGAATSQSTEYGDICRSGGAATSERVSLNGTCELAGPGSENYNLPAGETCLKQSDCLTDYCYDDNWDNTMTCETSQTSGAEDGVKVSDDSDCDGSSCVIGGKCYDPGSTVEFEGQTFVCEADTGDTETETEIVRRAEPSQKLEGTNWHILSQLKGPAFGLRPNTTNFNEGDAVRFDYVVRDHRAYCQENENSGFCTRIDGNQLNTLQVRTWFNSDIQRIDENVQLYGEERKEGSFTRTVPESTLRQSFFAEFQYDTTDSSSTEVAATRPYTEGLFNRSGVGGSCDNVLECEEGLYCGDTTGDGSQDTCLSQDSDYSGNVCDYYGSSAQERIDSSGACEFANPGFENQNLPEGSACRTTQDCLTDYCYDASGDGTMTCETSTVDASSSGVLGTEDSGGTNQCFYAGKWYSEGTTKQLTGQNTQTTCQNGVWQDEIQFNAEIPRGQTQGEQITVNYDVHNPRRCDPDAAWCNEDSNQEIHLQSIQFNLAGHHIEKSISGTVQEERNISGSVNINVPDAVHTDIFDTRVFLEYTDDSTSSTEMITAQPSIRGTSYPSKTSGSCEAGLQLAEGYYCLFDTEESPQNNGQIVQTSDQAGNLCEVPESSATEHRVTTDGACLPAETGYENRNLPDGYACNTEQDCISDYCYDMGSGYKTCQSEVENGTQTGIIGAKQSGSETTCHYSGRIYEEGSEVEVFGEDAVCNQSQWEYRSELGFKAEIPDNVVPGQDLQIDYSFFNPLQYCDFDEDVCRVLDSNKLQLDQMTVQFRNDRTTVNLNDEIAGGQRYDGTATVSVPDFDYTNNIPITTKTDLSWKHGRTVEKNFEVGKIESYGDTSVTFLNDFDEKPVVVAMGQEGADISMDAEASRAKISDVTTEGFNVIVENDKGNRVDQDVTFVAMKPGHYTIDGVEVEAGRYSISGATSGSPKTVSYQQNFPSNTALVDTLQNQCDEVPTSRYTEGTMNSSGYDVYWEGFATNSDLSCSSAEAGYIATERGSANNFWESGMVQDCAADPDGGTWCSASFNKAFSNQPALMLNPVESDGGDPSVAGIRNADSNGFETRPTEDRVDDKEQNHATDDMPWIAFRLKDTYTVKTTDVIRGSDWKRKTSADCRHGYATETGYYCLYNNETDVEFGSGDVRTTTESAGQICESPQATSTIERVTTNGACEPAQAGAQNNNQPDGYACQNQNDCISSYCYDGDMDGQKTCQPSASDGSVVGEKISEPDDCGGSACDLRGKCYAHGAEITYQGQTRYCSNGGLTEEAPVIDPQTTGEDLSTKDRNIRYNITKTDKNASAVGFNGASGGINLGNPSELQVTGSQTISMWIKPASIDSTRRNPWNKAYGGEGTITEETAGSGNWLNYYYGTAGENANPYQSFGTGMSAEDAEEDKWYHIVLVRDLNSMELKWYINGELDASATADYSSAAASSNDAKIGDGYTNGYNGDIDDVRVYNRPLSSSEVQQLYGQKYTDLNSGLVGWWPMNDGEGAVVEDKSGNNNDGSLITGEWKDKLVVDFEVTNDESETVSLYGTLVTSGYGNRDYRNYNIQLDPGQSYQFTETSQKPQTGTKQFYADSLVESSTIGFTKWTTSETTCYVAGWDGFQETCIRDDPQVASVEFSDAPDAHEFDISITGFDPNGGSDVQSCTIEAEHEDGGITEFTGNIDSSYGNSKEFECTYNNLGTSTSGYDPTDHLRLVMTVTDSEDKTGMAIEGHRIPNKVPTHDKPVVNPEPALSGDDVTGYSNNISDPENDAVSIEYNWTINGEPTGWDTQTLGSGNYSTYDWITLYVTPSDPYGSGETKSREIQIREAVVDIQEINFDNYTNRHAYNVSAVVNATDPAGIQTCQITASQNSESHVFNGDVNTDFGAADQVSCNYSSIDTSLEGLEPLGETEVEFFLEDENNANDTQSNVSQLPNNPPSVTAPTLDPDPARASEDLTGINGTPSDPEGDSVSYAYRWYINGTDIGYTGETLSSDNFDKGDKVTFETTPYDGYEYGEPNSTTVNVTDVEFAVSNLTFTDYSEEHAFNVSADIFAQNISDVQQCEVTADDQDGNSYTATGDIDTSYGGSEEALCTYSSISNSTTGFNATELIDVVVNVSTDTKSESVSGDHRIPNRAPTTNEPFISPDPAAADDTLTGSLGTTTDTEGDPITVQYEWFVNGNNKTKGNISTSEDVTLESGNFSAGDTVSFNVTPHDPYEFGEMNSTQIQISEGGLSITNITFEDSTNSHAYDTLVEINSDNISALESCSLEFSDGDGNSFSASGNIDTSHGGSTQALCTYSETGTSTTGFEVNEEIEANVTVSDDKGSVNDVATHIIPNRAPTFDQVLTDPLAPVNENSVTVNATISDAESDSIEWANFTVTHENGTELVSNQNGSIVDGEWISPEFSVDENINYSWTVESYDSFNKSNETGWFTTSNEAPDITSISTENVTGDHAYDIEFVVNDPDGDFDINTCSISASDGDGNSFSASADKDTSYGSSTEALCTYSSISDSTTGFEVNEIIDFDVNVTDSAGQTDGNQSQQIIPNRNPTVTLDAPEAGGIVTSPVDLSWTGSDEDGDSLSYNVTVATDSSLNNVVHTETTSLESVEVSGLSEGDYYWGIEADDSYSTVDSSVRNFTVSATIENVSITLEGDFDQVDADGEQISTGTYTDLSYPYIAMSDSAGLQGLVGYGSFVEAEYSTDNGRDKIRMKQKFSGERMLLVANNGDPEDLEQRREVVNSKELLDLPKASFTGIIPDESVVTALLTYTDIDLVGNETISPTGNTEILIRNEGTESGKVQVRIAER